MKWTILRKAIWEIIKEIPIFLLSAIAMFLIMLIITIPFVAIILLIHYLSGIDPGIIAISLLILMMLFLAIQEKYRKLEWNNSGKA